VLHEQSSLHVVDQWRYLGTAETPDDIPALLAAARPPFSAEIHAVLCRYAGQLLPL
jgi:hypothetical protein